MKLCLFTRPSSPAADSPQRQAELPLPRGRWTRTQMHWMQTPSVALVSLRQVFKPLSLPFGQLKSSHFCSQQKIAIHLSFTTYEMRR